MKMPNGELAVVEIEKLRDYCLNPRHPRGRSKARVFAAVGIRKAEAEELRAALLVAAASAEARLGLVNSYGQRYIIDFGLVRQGRTVTIRGIWIVLAGQNLPRLTTRYVL